MNSMVNSTNRKVKTVVKKTNHYLNNIKRSILGGTSKTSIELSIKDSYVLERICRDVIPAETLKIIGKEDLGEINTLFQEFKDWVKESKARIAEFVSSSSGLSDLDKVTLYDEFKQLEDELVTGDITSNPHAIISSYCSTGVTYSNSLISPEGMIVLKNTPLNVDRLRVACRTAVRTEEGIKLVEDSLIEESFKIPFPITYMVLADITEVKLLSNADVAPNTANALRARLSKNFLSMLSQNDLTKHQQMSLYRILGPERQQAKAAVEVNNNNQITNQPLIIIKDIAKLKPSNLVMGNNSELLGVGKAYGNIDKSSLLKLASGESLANAVDKS